MALRVLLADESNAIKKVFQLALQDYAVEVKAVQAGVDALEVAQTYKPDIVFADVLLQQRNGYDVCQDLKSDAKFSKTPVVLMWSSFMNLDEARYSECGASGRLEKPFDVSTLRGLVQKLVPKTQTQPLSSYLDLADMPPFEDDVAPQQAQVEAKYKAPIDELTNTKQEGTATSELDLPPPPARGTTKTSIPEPTEPDEWTMESFVSIEETMSDFPHDLVQEAESASSRPVQHGRTSNLSAVSSVGVREIELEDEAENSLTLDAPSPRPTRTATPELPQEDDSLAEGWGYQNLAKFKVKLPSEEVKSPETKHAATAKVKQPEPIPDVAPRIALSKAEIEALVREEAKKLIEGIVWKVVPEVAHNLVSQEIERLLKETKSEPPTL